MQRNKIVRRSTSPVGNQEKRTGTGKRQVAIPSTASNQLRIGTRDELKDPKQHQSRILLPTQAPAPKTYGTKSPAKRPVGRDQL